MENDKHMICISRVVLPELENQMKLDSKIESENDMGLSIYRFKTDDQMDVTTVVFHCKQENFWDPKEKKKAIEKFELTKQIKFRVVGPYLCYMRN